jgi:protein SOK2
VSSERLPALPQIQSHTSTSSTSSSPRGDSFSSGSAGGGSAGSSTSYAASVNGLAAGFKTPSPEQTPLSLNRNHQPVNAQSIHNSPFSTQDGYGFAPSAYNSMNQMQSYADVHQPHMATATHAPASAPPTGMSHYAYQPQPSMMQPQHPYSQAQPGYPPYGYGNGQIPASSSMNPAMVPSTLQLPGMFAIGSHIMNKTLTFTAMSSSAPASSLPGSQGYQTQTFDHTGQVAPPGMKPRVTATLWEDEGSLCFQVEAKGVCVARREGKHRLFDFELNAN